MAIAYALELLPTGFSAGEQKNWNTGGDLQVVLELEVDGKPVILYRGKVTKIEIHDQHEVRCIDGAKTYPSALRGILGVSTEVLSALCYRQQGEGSLFLSQTDAERKSFLAGVLDLEKLETLADTLDQEAKSLLNQKQVFEATLGRASEQLATLSVPDAPDVDTGAVQAEILQLQAALASSVPQKVELGIVPQLQIEADLGVKRKTKFSLALSSVLQGISTLGAELRTVELGLKKVAEAKAQLVELKNSTCFTCKQKWDVPEAQIVHLESELDKESSLLEQRQKTIEALKLSEGNREAITQKLEEENRLQEELAVRIKEEKQNEESLRQQELVKYQQKNAANIERMQMLGKTLSDVALQNQARETALATQAKLQKEKNSIEKQLSDVNQALALKQDLALALGRKGFLGAITETVLQEISQLANEALAELANVSNVSVRLTTETKLKDGRTKNSIDLEVFVGGVPVKFRSGLSGGMQTSVGQAIDFAILTVLQRRSGVSPNFIMMDEIFNGQGLTTKESSMTILKRLAKDKLVLVIDHDNHFKEQFDKTIDIEHDGMYSRVV